MTLPKMTMNGKATEYGTAYGGSTNPAADSQDKDDQRPLDLQIPSSKKRIAKNEKRQPIEMKKPFHVGCLQR
jgi:hypothetical protein